MGKNLAKLLGGLSFASFASGGFLAIASQDWPYDLDTIPLMQGSVGLGVASLASFVVSKYNISKKENRERELERMRKEYISKEMNKIQQIRDRERYAKMDLAEFAESLGCEHIRKY